MFIIITSVHIPGPHMLQHSPPFSYWVRGSHCGWAAVSVCRVNTESHITSYIQAVKKPPKQNHPGWTTGAVSLFSLCSSRGHNGKSPKNQAEILLMTPPAFHLLLLLFLFICFSISLLIYTFGSSIATVPILIGPGSGQLVRTNQDPMDSLENESESKMHTVAFNMHVQILHVCVQQYAEQWHYINFKTKTIQCDEPDETDGQWVTVSPLAAREGSKAQQWNLYSPSKSIISVSAAADSSRCLLLWWRWCWYWYWWWWWWWVSARCSSHFGKRQLRTAPARLTDLKPHTVPGTFHFSQDSWRHHKSSPLIRWKVDRCLPIVDGM